MEGEKRKCDLSAMTICNTAIVWKSHNLATFTQTKHVMLPFDFILSLFYDGDGDHGDLELV